MGYPSEDMEASCDEEMMENEENVDECDEEMSQETENSAGSGDSAAASSNEEDIEQRSREILRDIQTSSDDRTQLIWEKCVRNSGKHPEMPPLSIFRCMGVLNGVQFEKLDWLLQDTESKSLTLMKVRGEAIQNTTPLMKIHVFKDQIQMLKFLYVAKVNESGQLERAHEAIIISTKSCHAEMVSINGEMFQYIESFKGVPEHAQKIRNSLNELIDAIAIEKKSLPVLKKELRDQRAADLKGDSHNCVLKKRQCEEQDLTDKVGYLKDTLWKRRAHLKKLATNTKSRELQTDIAKLEEVWKAMEEENEKMRQMMKDTCGMEKEELLKEIARKEEIAEKDFNELHEEIINANENFFIEEECLLDKAEQQNLVKEKLAAEVEELERDYKAYENGLKRLNDLEKQMALIEFQNRELSEKNSRQREIRESPRSRKRCLSSGSSEDSLMTPRLRTTPTRDRDIFKVPRSQSSRSVKSSRLDKYHK
ncbi:cingulin-like [Lutzomyia longipalpis]|uniref:cingulin-like n=1 Tax=Lutzomyia longipalpis TaxID=7200 RepID=UPI0024840D71|nr:cingulin-like [Lutzomyia longipalpis]